jgi:hypothetical protein
LHPHLFLVCNAFCCLQGSLDCATLDSTKYLDYSPLLRLGASERNAGLSSVDDPHASAGVTYEIASPSVVGVQHAATPATSQKAGQQSVAPATSFPAAPNTHKVILAEIFLIPFELLPRYIAWMVILYQDAPFFDGFLVADGLLSPTLHNCGSGLCLAKRVRSRKDGIGKNPKNSMVHR